MIKQITNIETEGATVEEAVKKALKLLKAPRNAVTVKVVCEEKKGLFGMEGAKPAKVKVTVNKQEKP